MALDGVLSESIPANYEQQLNRNSRWALNEGSRHFDEKSAVHESLRKITTRLNELGISYAVAGGMALFQHGFRRFTEDVGLLVTRDGLKAIHKHLRGRGYLPPFEGSKNMRDTESGVRIEFLVTGDYPGDGLAKPVAFPVPDAASVMRDGVCYLDLPKLVELKIASGMTNSERIKDLADVQELIKLTALSRDFAEKLDPFVREKYAELWSAAHPAQKRYLRLWRNKFLTVDAQSLEEMVSSLVEAAETLKAMLADGVVLETPGGTADDYAYLVTSNSEIAKKYDMHDEAEFFGDKEEDQGQESLEQPM